MQMAVRYIISILLLAAICNHDAIGQSPEQGTLVVNVDTPVVEIGSRSSGRSFMRLPSLNYQFDLAAKCSPDLGPKAISLSIADTRKSLAAADISVDASTSVTLRIPASQIGPIAVDGFCASKNEQGSLRIPAVLSVQASLLCGNDEDSQMIYASKSLDVTLLCISPQK